MAGKIKGGKKITIRRKQGGEETTMGENKLGIE